MPNISQETYKAVNEGRTMTRIIAGVEEAGRGPVIGPMVVAGVSFEEGVEEQLRKLGVKDSKDLTRQQRDALEPEIEKLAKDIIVVKISACKIDGYQRDGVNLNRMETIKFADIINLLGPDVAVVDSPDVKPERLKAILQKMLKKEVELVVEHKADKNHPIVSAASIIAKVNRDREMDVLKKKYGELGSGYTHDPVTIAWLKAWKGPLPDIVRKSWATAEGLVAQKEQRGLFGFLKKKEECKPV